MKLSVRAFAVVSLLMVAPGACAVSAGNEADVPTGGNGDAQIEAPIDQPVDMHSIGQRTSLFVLSSESLSSYFEASYDRPVADIREFDDKEGRQIVEIVFNAGVGLRVSPSESYGILFPKQVEATESIPWFVDSRIPACVAYQFRERPRCGTWTTADELRAMQTGAVPPKDLRTYWKWVSIDEATEVVSRVTGVSILVDESVRRLSDFESKVEFRILSDNECGLFAVARNPNIEWTPFVGGVRIRAAVHVDAAAARTRVIALNAH